MAVEAKTKPTPVSVADFLASVADPKRRADGEALSALMREATGFEPVMWGPSIVGFGRYRYVYDSGHSGEAPLAAFSPRKANLVLYLMAGDDEREALLARLGRHKTGKACLYVNSLADVDAEVLRDLARLSVATLQARYPD